MNIYLHTKNHADMSYSLGDIQDSQNLKENYGASFKPKKYTHPWTKFFVKSTKKQFLGYFWGLTPK